MYQGHFGLRMEPFRLVPDPGFLYLSSKHAKAKTYLDFAIWNRDGFVVITGEIGSGKTTVLNSVLRGLDENIIVCKIHQTLLTESQLIKTVLSELHVSEPGLDKVELLRSLTTVLLEYHHLGRKVILVIDEAQNLGIKALEEIRLLSELEDNYERLLNIILVGQPELKKLLDSAELEQLSQRIRLRFHLKALSEQETEDYINTRLEIAGLPNQKIITPELIPLIYRYTGGIPRLINILCDTALVIAYAENKQVVSMDVLREAIRELQWVTFRRRKEKVRDRSILRKKRASLNTPVLSGIDELPLDIDLANLENKKSDA